MRKHTKKLTELRLDIIGHLKKLSLGFFKEHNTGELTNIVQHDVEQVEVYLAHGLPEIMSVTLLPTIIFVAMIFVDWRLALGMDCWSSTHVFSKSSFTENNG